MWCPHLDIKTRGIPNGYLSVSLRTDYHYAIIIKHVLSIINMFVLLIHFNVKPVFVVTWQSPSLSFIKIEFFEIRDALNNNHVFILSISSIKQTINIRFQLFI